MSQEEKENEDKTPSFSLLLPNPAALSSSGEEEGGEMEGGEKKERGGVHEEWDVSLEEEGISFDKSRNDETSLNVSFKKGEEGEEGKEEEGEGDVHIGREEGGGQGVKREESGKKEEEVKSSLISIPHIRFLFLLLFLFPSFFLSSFLSLTHYLSLFPSHKLALGNEENLHRKFLGTFLLLSLSLLFHHPLSFFSSLFFFSFPLLSMFFFFAKLP